MIWIMLHYMGRHKCLYRQRNSQVAIQFPMSELPLYRTVLRSWVATSYFSQNCKIMLAIEDLIVGIINFSFFMRVECLLLEKCYKFLFCLSTATQGACSRWWPTNLWIDNSEDAADLMTRTSWSVLRRGWAIIGSGSIHPKPSWQGLERVANYCD